MTSEQAELLTKASQCRYASHVNISRVDLQELLTAYAERDKLRAFVESIVRGEYKSLGGAQLPRSLQLVLDEVDTELIAAAKAALEKPND